MLKKRQERKNNGSLFLIGLYQVYMAPYFGGNCRFYPSCSCYARSAYDNFGWLKATVLTFNRVMKCHPFGPSGYDPLPPKEAQ